MLYLSRNLNDRLVNQSFHYQSVQDAVDKCSPGARLAKVDVEACFLNFFIRPEDSKWLCFAFTPPGDKPAVY